MIGNRCIRLPCSRSCSLNLPFTEPTQQMGSWAEHLSSTVCRECGYITGDAFAQIAPIRRPIQNGMSNDRPIQNDMWGIMWYRDLLNSTISIHCWHSWRRECQSIHIDLKAVFHSSTWQPTVLATSHWPHPVRPLRPKPLRQLPVTWTPPARSSSNAAATLGRR